MDCRMYKKRVYIKNLRSHMINVTLFGRIVAMANNVRNHTASVIVWVVSFMPH